MPKFNLYPYAGVEIRDDGATTPMPQTRRLSLGWSKDHTAQLGVSTLIRPESPGFKLKDDDTSPDQGTWATDWIDLDSRAMVNQLIRELRRARDDVFGRDE